MLLKTQDFLQKLRDDSDLIFKSPLGIFYQNDDSINNYFDFVTVNNLVLTTKGLGLPGHDNPIEGIELIFRLPDNAKVSVIFETWNLYSTRTTDRRDFSQVGLSINAKITVSMNMDTFQACKSSPIVVLNGSVGEIELRYHDPDPDAILDKKEYINVGTEKLKGYRLFQVKRGQYSVLPSFREYIYNYLKAFEEDREFNNFILKNYVIQ